MMAMLNPITPMNFVVLKQQRVIYLAYTLLGFFTLVITAILTVGTQIVVASGVG